MSNTTQRIIVGTIMALIAALAALGEYFGLPAVRVLGILVVLAMIVEFVLCLRRVPRDIVRANKLSLGGFLVWLFVMLAAINVVGARPWIVLLMLMIICGADIGAWLFGRLIGGDKMWERLSANKTWSGQIAGGAWVIEAAGLDAAPAVDQQDLLPYPCQLLRQLGHGVLAEVDADRVIKSEIIHTNIS